MVSKLVQLKRVTDGPGAESPAAGGYGSLGAKHPAGGQFLASFRKK